MKKIGMLTALAMILGLMGAFTLDQMSAASDGLVAYWAMDEESGATANDSSGYNNHGTLSCGRFGNALEFDGTDDFVEVPDSASLTPSSITVEAWVFADTSSLGAAFRSIVSKEDTSLKGYGLVIDSNGKLRFQLNFGSPPQACKSVASVPTSQWVHLAGTYDGSMIKCYIDGSLDGSSSFTGGITHSSNNIKIGMSSAVSAGFFDGRIDEVRISNIARDPGAYPAPPVPFSLPDVNTIGLWHFDDSFGLTAADATGNFDGTIAGASWAGPTWSKVEYAPVASNVASLRFDGVDDYVNVTDSDSLDTGTQFTIAAWFKNDNVHKVDPGTGSETQTIVMYGWDPADGKNNPLHIRDGTLYLAIRGYGPGYDDLVGVTPILSNEWYHAAVTYDGTTATLYLNGAEEVSQAATMSLNTDSRITIGRYQNPSNKNIYFHFDGFIDGVCVFERDLSAVEVALQVGGLQCDGIAGISLAPDDVINPIDSTHTVTATINPVVGDIPVFFDITAGPNAGDNGTNSTDSNGEATFTYTGDGGGGVDTIRACIDLDGEGDCDISEPQATVTKYWYNGRASGGGNVVDPHGVDKRRDWWHVSFGGAVYRIGASSSDVIGDWTTVFHNTSVSSVNKKAFEASAINKIVFDGASGEATRFVASGALDGVPGYVLVVRAEDAGEPGSGCEYDDWYCDNIRFSLFYGVPPSVAEYACGNVYDTSIDQGQSCTVPFVGGDFPDHSSSTFGAERTFLDSGNLQIMTLP